MKTFGPRLKPGSLLTDEKICRAALADIHQASCLASHVPDIDDILGIVEKISTFWLKEGNWLTAGMVLMHLGDQMLALQKIEEAQDYYEPAFLRFHVQVDSRHRQNEAAARYGMALTDLLSNHQRNAVHQLDQVLRLLEKAEHHWISIHADYRSARHCQRLQYEIEAIQSTLLSEVLSMSYDRLGFGYFRRNAGKMCTLIPVEQIVLPRPQLRIQPS
jgi:hypothetical protein